MWPVPFSPVCIHNLELAHLALQRTVRPSVRYFNTMMVARTFAAWTFAAWCRSPFVALPGSVLGFKIRQRGQAGCGNSRKRTKTRFTSLNIHRLYVQRLSDR